MVGKHTAGPWVAEPADDSGEVAIVSDARPYICTVHAGAIAGMTEANARLIAAAPDYAAWAEAILARGTHRSTLLLGTEDVIALQAIHARATQPLPPQSEEV